MDRSLPNPQRVDAEPVFKRGSLAVWSVQDIPVGIWRGQTETTLKLALEQRGFVQQSALAQRLSHQRPFLAAVHWDLLQPLKPVPRGRESMTAAQWGTTRDADGVCTICEADDSMWCDQAVHFLQGAVPPMPQISSLPARVRPSDTFSLAACTGEMINRRGVSQLARELWAADLAELVRKGEAQDQERERNRVLVDLEFEPWE